MSFWRNPRQPRRRTLDEGRPQRAQRTHRPQRGGGGGGEGRPYQHNQFENYYPDSSDHTSGSDFFSRSDDEGGYDSPTDTTDIEPRARRSVPPRDYKLGDTSSSEDEDDEEVAPRAPPTQNVFQHQSTPRMAGRPPSYYHGGPSMLHQPPLDDGGVVMAPSYGSDMHQLESEHEGDADVEPSNLDPSSAQEDDYKHRNTKKKAAGGPPLQQQQEQNVFSATTTQRNPLLLTRIRPLDSVFKSPVGSFPKLSAADGDRLRGVLSPHSPHSPCSIQVFDPSASLSSLISGSETLESPRSQVGKKSPIKQIFTVGDSAPFLPSVTHNTAGLSKEGDEDQSLSLSGREDLTEKEERNEEGIQSQHQTPKGNNPEALLSQPSDPSMAQLSQTHEEEDESGYVTVEQPPSAFVVDPIDSNPSKDEGPDSGSALEEAEEDIFDILNNLVEEFNDEVDSGSDNKGSSEEEQEEYGGRGNNNPDKASDDDEYIPVKGTDIDASDTSSDANSDDEAVNDGDFVEIQDADVAAPPSSGQSIDDDDDGSAKAPQKYENAPLTTIDQAGPLRNNEDNGFQGDTAPTDALNTPSRKPTRFAFVSDQEHVPSEMKQLRDRTIRRRRDLQIRMHDLECQLALVTSKYAEEKMDLDLALRDTSDRCIREPLEDVAERLYMERESSSLQPRLASLGRRLNEMDSQMTRHAYVTLQDAKRDELESLHDRLYQDTIPGFRIENSKSDKIEGGIVRRYESLSASMARQFHQECAERRGAVEGIQRKADKVVHQDQQRLEDILEVVSNIRTQLRREREIRKAEDKRLMNEIARTTETMKRALLAAVGGEN